MRVHVHVHVRTRVRVRVCACGCWTNIRLVHCFFFLTWTSLRHIRGRTQSSAQFRVPNHSAQLSRDTNAPLRDSNAPLRDANDPLTLLITCRCACACGHAHPAFQPLCTSRISNLRGSYSAHAHRGGILNAAVCSDTLCMQSAASLLAPQGGTPCM